MATGRIQPCTAGCGAVGAFLSDPHGRCKECRKVECKRCGVKFSPNRGNTLRLCYQCKKVRSKQLNEYAEAVHDS